MIVLRSREEIDRIGKAGQIAAYALEKVRQSAHAGVTTKELDTIANEEIERRGGVSAFKNYKGYPANICTSVNEVVVHGIPSTAKLKNGDILSVDIGVRYDGYCADSAITVPVGAITDAAKRLMDVTQESLYRGILKARPGNRLSDISWAIQEFVEAQGFSVVRALVGHGIGTKVHEEPEVPNYGKPGRGPRLEKGMILAIEPMVNTGTYDVECLKDGWTTVTKDRLLSAHFEHTIAIDDGDAQILTKI